MKVQLLAEYGEIKRFEHFNKELVRAFEYETDHNKKTLKEVFEGGAKPGEFEIDVDVDYIPSYTGEDFFDERHHDFHSKVAQFFVDELLTDGSSTMEMYKRYIDELSLEDNAESKAEYATVMMNNGVLVDNDRSMSGKTYLCTFPPHNGNWWVKFNVPDIVEDERYKRNSEGKYDVSDANVLETERGGYPIGAAFDTLRSYSRECIEKFYIRKYIYFLFYDCPDNTGREYRNYLDYRVNLD